MVLVTAPQRLPVRIEGIYASILQLSGVVYDGYKLDICLGTEEGDTVSFILAGHGTLVDANSVCLMPSCSFARYHLVNGNDLNSGGYLVEFGK